MASDVTAEQRRTVASRAYHVCEYCLVHEEDNYFACEVDHIISIKHGGRTELSNLAYACFRCNRQKGTDIASLALSTGALTRFFNPRIDAWAVHFYLRDAHIEPLTDIGEVSSDIRVQYWRKIGAATHSGRAWALPNNRCFGSNERIVMRLFDAILDANHRALSGDTRAGLRPEEHSAALPIIALTCIDPRLNPLMPEVLGVPEEHFIWLRNAGNIVTGPMSSTMRALALACAVKGGKEIVVIGHSDCLVCKTTALELTDEFARLGVPRSKLPDNLQEFFGLFASERQNVLRAVEFIRQSPLIGPKVPVHGLLVDVGNGRLESIVNGYQTLERVVAEPAPRETLQSIRDLDRIGNFNATEMKAPEVKIGEAVTPIRPEPIRMAAVTPPEPEESEPVTASYGAPDSGLRFDPAGVFKIVGTDRKIYGPYTADELEHWINEGRIALDALAQRVGYKEWKQLKEFVRDKASHIPVPPRLASLKMRKPERRSK